MKKPLIFLVVALLFIQCEKFDSDYQRNTEYEPILIERSELEQSVKWLDSRELVNTGKIYIKDNYLFIGEKFEGVHIFDNTDPSNPIPLGFIAIPGNVDISIKGDIIYADNTVDLIAIQFQGNSIKVLDRNVGVFPEMRPPDNLGIPYEYTVENRPENTLIVKWIKK
jgi:hypothetical protein